jgi:Zn-dependent protease/CBS domain-containing protein
MAQRPETPPAPSGSGTRPDGDPPDDRARPGLMIGRVRGVPVYLSPLAAIFAVIIASLLAGSNRDQLRGSDDAIVFLVAAITSLGFLASLVAHELGHCLVALGFGLRVRSVVVHGFAGFTEIDPEPGSPGREFLVAVAGPLVNGLLAGAGFAVLTGLSSDTETGMVILDLSVINLVLFIFNLAPGLPLDGGRLVVAAVWRATRDRLRGLRVGAYAGFLVAAAVAVWGLSTSNSRLGGLYIVGVAAFLGMGAYQALRQAQLRARLPGLIAGRLARRTLPVAPDVPLAEALRHARQSGASAVAVVDTEGTPVKIMNGAAVDALPEHRRPWMSINEVSRTIEPGMIIDADLEGDDLLTAIRRAPATEYLVVQRGRPVGVLAMVDLVARLDPASAQRMAGSR